MGKDTQWVLYHLLCPFTKECRYVGITTDLDSRWKAHAFYDSGCTAKAAWVFGLNICGSLPLMQVVRYFDKGTDKKSVLSHERLETLRMQTNRHPLVGEVSWKNWILPDDMEPAECVVSSLHAMRFVGGSSGWKRKPFLALLNCVISEIEKVPYLDLWDGRLQEVAATLTQGATS